ncbi:MAG: biotin--[acetyl-CoA-carboxylase] ligase [Ruminococcaceae bacterium]|nr:biotin--[acetyl-CoA-carboxylase] ligase [Oscillospiraceae bacterium]
MSLTKLAEVSSTNTWLKERCGELSHGDAVTALRQTEGRGRIGHEWLGHDGMLPLSVLLKDVPEPDTLTLRASLAVCRALEPVVGTELAIKWPNDIILHGHKLCGILCESVMKCDSRCIICGVGVNLSQPAQYFVDAGIPHGGSLLSLNGIQADRDALAQQLTELIAEYSRTGFNEVIEEYRRRCVTLGREVRLLGNTERTAYALDIAQDGALICRDSDGEFNVNSGEVSVRGLMDYI